MNVKKYLYRLSRKQKLWLALFFAWLIHFYFILPKPLFDTSYSKVLFDTDNTILSVRIAEDEQWRFPEIDTLPEKYALAVQYFEDEYFHYHLGINPISLLRATWQNVRSGEVQSGASTLTMQVIRLSRKNPKRTVREKLYEMYLATRLELSLSKKSILKAYATHAPFGGNVIGLEAASRKYFGRAPKDLSWSEAATLAVLPNSPSLIFPGKNNHLLLEKKNRLLVKLHENEVIDSLTLSLALEEPLPTEFLQFPDHARHVLQYCVKKYPTKNKLYSTIQPDLQRRCESIVKHYSSIYRHNHIYNAAALVIDNRTNQAIAYIGNTKDKEDRYENFVDVIQAPRSSGSILKPFLHTAAMDEGIILNTSLLPDIPSIISGFAPKNFNKKYDGAVKANQALARSLNVPAVLLLKEYGYPKLHAKLKQIGMTTLKEVPDHYGLSLILGGAEVTLWDITSMYSGMAKSLNDFEDAPLNTSYSWQHFSKPTILQHEEKVTNQWVEEGAFTAGSIYQTFEALLELKRPDEEGNWKLFSSSQKIAWKTGTSYGLRDAWAVGVTPEYTIGIWVGNATGEGRPGLIGVKKAAPLLFSVLNALPTSSWFTKPNRDMYETSVCYYSGMKAGQNCYQVDTLDVGNVARKGESCHYCQQFYVNEKGQRVTTACTDLGNMKEQKQFVLPSVQEWYYKQKTTDYASLPEWKDACLQNIDDKAIGLIYPIHKGKVYIPKELEGERGKLICEATHKQKGMKIYWHLNDQFLGATTKNHQMPIDYKKGIHQLVLLDDNGEEIRIEFEVL